MKLAEGLYLVGSADFGLSDDYDCHVYLLDGGSEAALIDAGGGRDVPAILSVIEGDGVPLERIRYLLLTHGHADHSGGAATLRDALDLQVLAAHDIVDFLREGDERGISLDLAREAGIYPPDFAFRTCPVDGELVQGQRVEVGALKLTVIETPGHSAGSLCFLAERNGERLLFAGDTVFFGGRILLQNIPDCDLQAHLRSIERLSTLAVDVFLPGHRGIALRDGQRHIQAAMDALNRLGVPPNLI
jgi:glyoxylase-like metal-dependent hydrolase (beta-lactamase superfamily II)